MGETNSIHAPSPGFLALQLTILTLSACTDWLPLSILNVTFLIKKVHTSSQNRYVSRLPWRKEGAGGDRPPWRQHIHTSWGAFLFQTAANGTNLELQPTLDVLLQRLGDGLVEVAENFHGELGIDALFADQVVEGVCQSEPDAVNFVLPWLLVFFLVVQFPFHPVVGLGHEFWCGEAPTCFDGRARRTTVLRKPWLVIQRLYTLCSAKGFRVYRGVDVQRRNLFCEVDVG